MRFSAIYPNIDRANGGSLKGMIDQRCSVSIKRKLSGG